MMAAITIDGVSFELKNDSFNFDFLREYGRVFAVFDQNDSGNISFGVEDSTNRYFIKVGGAQTLNKSDKQKTEDVISSLVHAADVYRALQHPLLINLVEEREIPGGYILVFDWVDGECMHAHWTFDQYPKHTHAQSAFYRYIRLEPRILLKSLHDIFEFHKFAASKNYVAIDFYDGSVMFDFARAKTIICDIDFYDKSPYVNNMERLWGSSRFMSPEEFIKGAVIDEITNVYTMGAAAFAFLGGEKDRSFTKWRMGRNLYDVALKAVHDDRRDRYKTIDEFMRNWDEALLLDKTLM